MPESGKKKPAKKKTSLSSTWFEGIGGTGGRIAFSPDGNLFAMAYAVKNRNKGTVAVYEVATGKLIQKYANTGLKCLAFSADSRCIAVQFEGVTVFDIDTGNKIRVKGKDLCIAPNFEDYSYCCFSPDGSLLAILGEYETDFEYNDPYMTSLALLDVKNGAVLWEERDALFERGVFAPEGNVLYTIGTGSINRWKTSSVAAVDIRTGDEQTIFSMPDNMRFYALDISPDGETLAVGGAFGLDEHMDAPIILIDLHSKRERKLRPDGRSYMSKEEIRRLNGHTNSVFAVAYSPDGNYIASGGNDRTIRVWDTRSGTQQRELSGGRYRAQELAFTPDGTILATANGTNLHFFHTDSWEEIMVNHYG